MAFDWAGHRGRLRAIIRLALPVTGARVGMLTMSTIDTVMLGHAGARDLAFYAVSAAAQLTLTTVGLGFLAGTQVLVAQARGAGELHRIGQIWRVAMALALLMGIGGGAALWQGKQALDWVGIAADIAKGSEGALQMVAWGVPGGLLYMASALTLEGLGRPRAGLVVVLAANLLKLVLNWLLIFGPFGLPELGAVGANAATSAIRWLMCLTLSVHLVRHLGKRREFVPPHRRESFPTTLARLVRLGAPIGVAQGLENAAFTALAGFAALLGTSALATYQIAVNVIALLFMVSSGIATATAVQVGLSVGRGDRPGLAASAWLGAGLEAAVMVVAGLLIAGGRGIVTGFYTHDPALLAVAVPVMAIAALAILPDGLQGVLMGALRGTGDVVMPTFLHLVSFWAVAVPISWHLGFERRLGVEGLFLGLSLGLIVASVFLALRLLAIARRPARRL